MTNTNHSPLRQAREAAGLSRLQVAYAVGVSYTRVANVECGRSRHIPPAWRAGMVALGLDYDALTVEQAAWSDVTFGLADQLGAAK